MSSNTDIETLYKHIRNTLPLQIAEDIVSVDSAIDLFRETIKFINSAGIRIEITDNPEDNSCFGKMIRQHNAEISKTTI